MFGFAEGTNYHKPLSFKDEDGNAIDLTSATNLAARIYREPREGAVALQTYESGTGITVTSAVDGEVTLDFDDADLTAGEYTYEVTVTLASGDIAFLGRGWFRVFVSHAL